MDVEKYSIVIPVYGNQESLEDLVGNLESLVGKIPGELEVIFVVDGSPDESLRVLMDHLPRAAFRSQLLALSRNFGSFPAIAAGLNASSGDYISIIAADLQEPPDLPLRFFEELKGGECDLVVGQRIARDDPLLSKFMASSFWFLYRKLVQRNMPPGGIDVFACNRRVRDTLVQFTESNTSLVGLLLWVGFRRRVIAYRRLPRPYGTSAWSLKRKLRYLKDSIFAFSDLPIRALGLVGILGILIALGMSLVVLIAKLTGRIDVPGYTAEVITIVFFGGLNSLGLSLIGEYLWRAFENSKRRPRFIVMTQQQYGPENAKASSTLDEIARSH